MATTSTSTSARTHTRPRLATLQHQVETTMRKVASADEHRLDLFSRGLKERWIERIFVYAFDHEQYAIAELRLGVDWSVHDRENQKAPEVTVKSEDGVTDDLKIYTRSFQRFLNEYAAQVGEVAWHVQYTAEVYADPKLLAHVDKVLKLQPCHAATWRGEQDTLQCNDDNLDELRLLYQYSVNVG